MPRRWRAYKSLEWFIFIGFAMAAFFALVATLMLIMGGRQARVVVWHSTRQKAVESIFGNPQLQQTVHVYDHDSGTPIENAKVAVEFSVGWGSYAYKDYFTNPDGTITFSLHDAAPNETIGQTNHISVVKAGYHINGINVGDDFNGHKISDARDMTVRLRKIKNPQSLIIKKINFHQGDQADFLYALVGKDYAKIGNISSGISTAAIDFEFTVVGNTAVEKTVIGQGLATIRFYGAGGIQQLPNGGARYSGSEDPYALENLLEAPLDGYTQELALASGAQYVARLRDGQHYMKLTPFIFKALDGTNYIRMTFFIQPEATNNLENLNTMPSADAAILAE